MASPTHHAEFGLDPARARTKKRLHDIQHEACTLVVERGYDGFTMDELAAAVGVSRRTLFNYVPDKSSAVLGRSDAGTNSCIEEFRAGGPSGKLVPDIVHAVDSFLEDPHEPIHSIDHHLLVQRAIAADPKVAQLAIARFVELAELLATLICERQGWPEGDLRALAASSTCLALIKLALDQFTRDETNADFRTVFHQVLDADRAVRSMA